MAMNLGSFASRVVATKVVATDGSGDFTNIQDAIDDLPAGGGVVYIKEGTYIITAAINVDKDNVALIGAGKSTKITATTAITMISLSNRTGCLISQIYLYGSYLIGNIGISLSTCTNCTVSNCWIERCNYGIDASASTSCNIISNYFNDCRFSSFKFNVATYCIFASNQIIDNGVAGNTFGIQCLGATYCEIINNIIRDSTGSGAYLDRIDYCVIKGNIIYNNAHNGLVISAPALSDAIYNIIEGNQIVGNNTSTSGFTYGLQLGSGATKNIVIGNFIRDNGPIDLQVVDNDQAISHNWTA